MAHPFPLFESIWTPSREIAVTPEVSEALRNGAAVAIGVSGGKDSAATAFATVDYLNEMGHQGPRLLIHSDLGRVEWRQSLHVCEELAVFWFSVKMRATSGRRGGNSALLAGIFKA